ncbi:MAG: hypothetical protein HC945_03970 [Nitrosarchaeum sp.]|nr:hypothetical protein [Nitrosarchaeum sp.]
MAGYFAADGTVSKDGQVSINSVNKDNLLFVKDVCSILGIGTYSICTDSRISNLTDKPHTMYELTFMRDTLTEEFFINTSHKDRWLANASTRKKHWSVLSVEKTDRREEVYCAQVRDHYKFTLEGNILTGNCGFISTRDLKEDFADPFCWLMDMLMLGVGVGFDTKGAGTLKIQEPKQGDDIFVVEDSREGWVALFRRILTAYVGKGSIPHSIDYSKVRPYGEPIKGLVELLQGQDLFKNS